MKGVSYTFLPPNDANGRARADSSKPRSRMPVEPPNSPTATVCIQTSQSRLTRGSSGPFSEVGKLGEVFPVALSETSGEHHDPLDHHASQDLDALDNCPLSVARMSELPVPRQNSPAAPERAFG